MQNLFSIYLVPWVPFLLAFIVGGIIVFGYSKWLENRSKTNLPHSEFVPHLIGLILIATFVVTLIISSPLNETTEGQLLSLIGILLTAAIALSSTTFLGNILGGLMIRMLKKITPGGFLKVGEHFGKVTELGLLHCEIQTIDRGLTTIPNLFLVTNPVEVMQSSGIVISEELSLGYDINRHDIESALLSSAESSGLTEPFVQVMSLGDYSVTYKISGFLKDVNKLISAQSRLREHVLDGLHDTNIEIVSPTFMNQRVYSESSKFISKSKKVFSEKESNIGDIVFDKANVAGSIEKLKNQVSDIESEINSIKNNEVNVLNDRDKSKQIELLEKRKVKIIEFIKTKSEK